MKDSLTRDLMLLLIKAVPMVGVICCACNSILSYFYIETEWLGYVMCITFLIAWIVLAIYFRFCIFYFMLVFYIIACEFLNILDYFDKLDISDRGLFVLHCGLLGITIISATYAHVKHSKRTKKSVR